jgi:hypothetical protein
MQGSFVGVNFTKNILVGYRTRHNHHFLQISRGGLATKNDDQLAAAQRCINNYII